MKLILAFDNDEAGRKATLRATSLILKMLLQDIANLLRWPIYEIIGQGYIGKYHFWTYEEMNELDKIAKEYQAPKITDWVIKEVFLGLKPASDGKITDADIAKAKEFPINQLLEFKRGFTHCIWHNDINPSMYYYEKSNKVYCFSCSKNADVIDVVQKLKGYSFIQTINFLCGK